jgi:hypothetical protein
LWVPGARSTATFDDNALPDALDVAHHVGYCFDKTVLGCFFDQGIEYLALQGVGLRFDLKATDEAALRLLGDVAEALQLAHAQAAMCRETPCNRAASNVCPVPPTYDQQPPFWFSHALWVGLPFAMLMTLAGAYQSLLLLVLGLVPLLVFMCLSTMWSRRHKVE